MAAASSKSFRSLLWKALDRILFVGLGSLAAIATTYYTGLLKLSPPKLVALPIFNHIENTPISDKIGGLKLNYKNDRSRPYGVLRIDVVNKGRGVAEDVRLQVRLPQGLKMAYQITPDFRVYKPSVPPSLNANEFYTELPRFPSKASDWIAFRVEGDAALLCDARIKFVSKNYEGKVSPIKGVEGCP